MNLPTYVVRPYILHTTYIHTTYLHALTKWLLTTYNKYLRTRLAMHLPQSINRHWWSLQVADEIRICWRTEENIVESKTERLSKLFAYYSDDLINYSRGRWYEKYETYLRLSTSMFFPNTRSIHVPPSVVAWEEVDIYTITLNFYNFSIFSLTLSLSIFWYITYYDVYQKMKNDSVNVTINF